MRPCRRVAGLSGHGPARAGRGRLHHPRLYPDNRSVVAGAADALSDPGTAAAGRRRPDRECGPAAARHGRDGCPVPVAAVRGRTVRARTAAGYRALLHHHARQSGPWRLVQALGRTAGAVPGIRLCRHGRGPTAAAGRRAGGRPGAADAGHLDGLYAHLRLGRGSPGLCPGPDAHGLPADGHRRAQPAVADHAEGRDPQRSRLGRRRLCGPARRGAADGG